MRLNREIHLPAGRPGQLLGRSVGAHQGAELGQVPGDLLPAHVRPEIIENRRAPLPGDRPFMATILPGFGPDLRTNYLGTLRVTRAFVHRRKS